MPMLIWVSFNPFNKLEFDYQWFEPSSGYIWETYNASRCVEYVPYSLTKLLCRED